jgi:hypothetical protein
MGGDREERGRGEIEVQSAFPQYSQLIQSKSITLLQQQLK